jgi:glycosyltransferase involved in cell wall biosynthesis
VDVDRFSPRPKPQAGPFQFLLVARLLWDKGVGEFVQAARIVKARHPDVEFALAGFLDVDNPSAVPRSAVEEWEREGVIKFLGSFDDMVPVYAQADCVVLPSYREGMPRTLLEAASMAKPTITSDAPGCREAVVNGVTGLIVKTRDGHSLAMAMLELLQMPQKQHDALCQAARERILDEFDEAIVIGAYAQRLCAES